MASSSLAPVVSPIVRVAAPSPAPVVFVPVSNNPAVVRTQSLGPQGAPGPTGPQGANGYAKRFGTIDYTDNDAVVYDANGAQIGGTALDLPAGQWVRVTRNLTPSPANFNLPSGPWAGFAFWDNVNGILKARAVGDIYLFKFSFTVIPQQKNGGLRFAVRPGPSPGDPSLDFGPEPIVLTADAGQAQAGSETFSEQVRTKFATSGALVYLMATSGGTLTEFSPEVIPLDFAGS